jgi:hypothetical protein
MLVDTLWSMANFRVRRKVGVNFDPKWKFSILAGYTQDALATPWNWRCSDILQV